MSNVMDYGTERAQRTSPDLEPLDDELADDVSREMAAALGRAETLPEPVRPTSGPAFELERCRPWLEPALAGGFYGWADVVCALAEGRAQLFPGAAAAIVTETVDYPNGSKAMQVWLAGGDMDEVVAMAPGLMSVARMMGCTDILVEGRKGWERVLGALGFTFFSTTLRKVL